MKKVEDLVLEEITWEDHFSNEAWITQEDLVKDDGGIFVTSVGYRLKETKNKVVLVQNVATNGHVSCAMTILKKTITKRNIVKENKEVK